MPSSRRQREKRRKAAAAAQEGEETIDDADGGYSPAEAAPAAPAPAPAAPGRLDVEVVVEPTAAHEASVILLHGFGDRGTYWSPFYDALRMSGTQIDGVRWLALNAPKRKVWGSRDWAWFQYLGKDRSGQSVEDNINEDHLVEVRTALHGLIQGEIAAQRGSGGEGRVVLVGSSQGASVALDAGLTAPGSVAGVAMLRGLALGATAEAVGMGARGPAVPVLAVSGGADDTFVLDLVKRQLALLGPAASVSHEVISYLDHDTQYDTRETALTIDFLVERLCLVRSGASGLDMQALAEALPDIQEPARDKMWAKLTDDEQRSARALGITGANAWDSGTAPVWSKAWRKLTEPQKRAAERLGFDQKSWDAG